MLDGVSLDQIRIFLAAADAGSFSAASRRLGRAQSAVSQTIANLEAQMGVALFDRSGRYPRLTAEGGALLADARAVASGVDAMKARAKGMARGLEPELSVVFDVMFPMAALTLAARAFAERFPGTPLRLHVEALGAVFQPVLDGRCGFAVAGTLPLMPAGWVSERLGEVVMAMVAAPFHPLAAHRGAVPRAEASRHVQLVLTDRSELSAGREFGVVSPLTWRLADLGAKRAFLLNGLGWGGMPRHGVAEDLAAGRLTELAIEDLPADGMPMPMAAAWPAGAPPGPAGRWLIERLKQRCEGRDGAERGDGVPPGGGNA